MPLKLTAHTPGVAGTLILDSHDSGYDENKDNWFAEGAIWSGSATRTADATITATADTYGWPSNLMNPKNTADSN